MIPQVVTVGPLTVAVATAVAASQTPVAGNLIINGSLAAGGVATLDTARRVIITSAGDNTTDTFTLYGTNATGNAISETIAGTNTSAAQSAQDYKTVTRISVTPNAVSAVTVGTNGVASSPWQAANYHFGPMSTAFNAVVSGTVTFTVQATLDNPNAVGIIAGVIPTPLPTAGSVPIASGSIPVNAIYTGPMTYWRVLVTAQTNPGAVTVTAVQAGLEN